MIPQAIPSSERSLANRALAFAELAKPELTGLSALTSVVACLLAGTGEGGLGTAVQVGVGTLLVGSAAGTINQVLERRQDAMMKRTERRPIPSGRVKTAHALISGFILAVAGVGALAYWFDWMAASLAALTLALYLGPYTSLKRITWVNTLVGAVPGSLPVLIGWTAASKDISISGWALFGVVYFWQIPHFLALAWMYKKDYARASFRMLSTIRASKGLSTGSVSALSCIGLIISSGYFGYYIIEPFLIGISITLLGVLFSLPAVGMLVAAYRGDEVLMNRRSRVLFFASLAYLPMFMVLALLGKA